MRRGERKHRHDDRDVETGVPDVGASGPERREGLDDATESVLDDIDALLDEEAEEFVRSYVQKGGQ
ncbi:ubiquitin-like protein Pup [Saccharopolyspora sp. NFXS83]|uniref:ubiquitin-like protein Pup n=1 Tax=Saccharopolyspora sp. NFXS83 TaxID=2993560 RepID=UPI00224A6B70|nr:ubiquitin-like protein Pup [Saccharopolyspora sp. NFXS83]MCX2729395.1 ubiquitin-like protein Pup [Saccharopolyspora sp. NFXS83]